MRKLSWCAGLAVAALLGWASVTSAQPLKLPPIEAEPEPFDVPTPGKIPEPETPKLPPVEDAKPVPALPPLGPADPVMPDPETPEPAAMGNATKPIAKPEAPVVPSSEPKATDPNVLKMFQGSPFAEQADPSMTPGNPTGRQEPAVSIEWIGPATSKVGQPADYTLAVRNACDIAVQKVIVQVRLPEGVKVESSAPNAQPDAGNVMMWELGTMMPKQEKHLRVAMVAPAKGDMSCQAWVTFTGSSVMTMRVREPKLLLKSEGTDGALVGDPVNFTLTVSNPGDHPAERITLTAKLSEGLQHAQGSEVKFELGNLAPNETRTVQVLCMAKAGGEQTCDVVANAEGLEATAKSAVEVSMPRLDIAVENGPKLRYLERKAMYTVSVTNPGDASAKNVVLSDVIPAGFQYVASDGGGRHDFASRTVQWYLGEIGPGQKKTVKLEVLAVNPGEHRHVFTARASRGLEVKADTLTKVEGLSAMLIEVVDIDDPIEVGADTGYEIRVTNTGSKNETAVKLVCTIPPQMKFKAAQAPVKYSVVGNEIVFEPLGKLAPRADAIYRIIATAEEMGDARFTARLTSTNLVEPVREDEATRIYAD